MTEGGVFQDDVFQDRRAPGPRAPDNAQNVASTWASSVPTIAAD
jgi:hypothetical protein